MTHFLMEKTAGLFPCADARAELTEEVDGWAWRMLPPRFSAGMDDVELWGGDGEGCIGECNAVQALEYARKQANERGHQVEIRDLGEPFNVIATVDPDDLGLIHDEAQAVLGAGIPDLEALAPDPRDLTMRENCQTCGAKPGELCMRDTTGAPTREEEELERAELVREAEARSAARRAEKRRGKEKKPELVVRAPRPVTPTADPAPAPVTPKPAPAPAPKPPAVKAPAKPAGQANGMGVAKLPTDSGNNERDIMGNRAMVELIRERGVDGVTVADLRDASGFKSIPTGWVAKLAQKNGFAIEAVKADGAQRFFMVQPSNSHADHAAG